MLKDAEQRKNDNELLARKNDAKLKKFIASRHQHFMSLPKEVVIQKALCWDYCVILASRNARV